MLGLLIALAVVAAVVATAVRRARRAALRRASRTRPGASPGLAIAIRSYTEMDDHLGRRWCGHCGGYLERRGEGSREEAGRRFRIARLECQECERTEEVYFETTELVH